MGNIPLENKQLSCQFFRKLHFLKYPVRRLPITAKKTAGIPSVIRIPAVFVLLKNRPVFIAGNYKEFVFSVIRRFFDKYSLKQVEPKIQTAPIAPWAERGSFKRKVLKMMATTGSM